MHSTKKRIALLAATFLAIAAVATTAFALHQAPAQAASGSTQQTSLQTISLTGTGRISGGATSLVGDGPHDATPADDDRDQHTGAVYADAPTVSPDPTSNPVTSSNPGASGFTGLNHVDTRSQDGGNAFSLEPPDQGMCVGNGFVVEAVNDVMVVFNQSGQRISPTSSMNSFFGLPVAINRATGERGPFLSDPKCLYDAGTNRFFLTILEEDPAPSVRAHTLIAVSQTSDPRGSWFLYSIDATDDGLNGTPSNPDCPCFGDQPLIGANGDGFFISTNEFPSFVGGFNGAQVYAMSKSGLISGVTEKVVHINAGTIPTPDAGGIWYSIQPATTPPGSPMGLGQAIHTEFFLSALQFGPAPLDNRIAVWSLGNTGALRSGNPAAVTLAHTVISSETYGQPGNAPQKAGDFPQGQLLGEPENQLAGNDDRMNQVVYANGMLWSGVNTVIGDGSQVGIAYFIVSPKLIGQSLSATMAKQGYVTVDNNSVLFPSIGVNPAGQGVMGFTVSGPDYYPSAAYVAVDATHGAGAVHISGAGVGPADGFTGYPEFGGSGVERWGDYSAAVAGQDGSIWLATEYIAQSCTVAQYSADPTCGGTRTSLANWSTFITHVTP
jgi:hypothetical protein